jgi:hypothetical protein
VRDKPQVPGTSGRLSPVVARVACALCAVAALLLAVIAGSDLYLTGFPDSHLTNYDVAATTPKRVMTWVEIGFVFFFLLLAFSPISARVRSFGLLAGMSALILVVLAQWVGIPWYFVNHLGLDNGIGG